MLEEHRSKVNFFSPWRVIGKLHESSVLGIGTEKGKGTRGKVSLLSS